MGILNDAFAPSSEKALSLFDLLKNSTGWANSASGRLVNEKTATQVATVYAVCRVIGEGLGQVPLKLMVENESTEAKKEAKDHPLYEILNFKPNSFQTAFEYFEMIGWHTVLTGNHYSFINRSSRGKIYELLPFQPNLVTVKRDKNWNLTYEVRAEDGELKVFPAETIWHVRGPSWDGWNGLECVKLARDAIGLTMSTEQAAAALHKNGLMTSGAYSVEGNLKPGQYAALSEWINNHHAGAANAGKPLILDRSAKWLGSQMTGVDAQSYETRRFQIEEICRFARVMPIMVGHADKTATYASAEQMFLAHLVHTMAPWYRRIEQSIDANLLTKADREAGIYSNFVEEAMLRGSAKDTQEILLGYVNDGLMTPNEGRAKLDMNPDADPASNKLRIPANITGSVPDANNNPKPESTMKALEDLALDVKSLRDRKPEQPINNITVNTPEQVTNVAAPVVNFTAPEIKAPDVHLDIQPTTINVPQPIINFESAPITVNVPEPNINLEATMPAPEVTVNLPPRKTETTVERDAAGNIVYATQVETDV